MESPPRQALFRDENVNVVGLRLKREIESCRSLLALSGYVEGVELNGLARELGFVP